MDFPALWPNSISKVTARQQGGRLHWVPEEADQFRSQRRQLRPDPVGTWIRADQIPVRRQIRSLRRQVGRSDQI